MKKIILALKGRANIGKTSSLSMLIKMFHNQPITNHIEDTRIVFEYRGFNIAITTWGDNADEMKKNVNFLKQCSWDIAIIATRTRGETCTIVKAYATNLKAELKWVNKDPDERDEVRNNLQTAKQLYATIEDIINQWENRP